MRNISTLLVALSSIFWAVNASIIQDEPIYQNPQPTPFQDWDYLVYSQRWPVTACAIWQEKKSNNQCAMPQNETLMWTVHGVWPNKIGADGPFFCNSAIHFDPDQLQPLLPNLDEHWTNIEGNTKKYSFWKHEWDKHGTCASVLPYLNSIPNYFQKGLDWNQQYHLSDILAKSQIIPQQEGYTAQDIFNAVKSSINKNPDVQCDVDSITKESLISEIRICFDKNLEVIDCNVTKPLEDGDVLGNCALKKPVMYLAKVPSLGEYDDIFVQDCLEKSLEANLNYREKLLNFYAMVKFLIWYTL